MDTGRRIVGKLGLKSLSPDESASRVRNLAARGGSGCFGDGQKSIV